MTISYAAEIATVKGYGCFIKLLKRWRGSIYKLIWIDLLIFLSLFYLLGIIYRVFLSPTHRETFERVVVYCQTYGTLIPLIFVLGFFVSVVMTRWWTQYIEMPNPDKTAVYISAFLHGQDDRGRVMRRTIMRYVCLCQTMVLHRISHRVKKRFPTTGHYVNAGLINENERVVMDAIENLYPNYSKHWMPIVWAASIISRARKEGRIRDDNSLRTIMDEMNAFRGSCGWLLYYDGVNIPLVYVQVVTLAVYSYFLSCVIGKQWLYDHSTSGYYDIINYYFPILPTLEFFFYMGWLKVAESIINPWGEDDDDFEVNWLIDRNLLVSYLIVDDMHNVHPELVKDLHWDLAYSEPTDQRAEDPPPASTAHIAAHATQKAVDLANVKVDIIHQNTQLPASASGYTIDMPRIRRLLGIDVPQAERESLSRVLGPFSSEDSIFQDSLTDFENLKEDRHKAHLNKQREDIENIIENVESSESDDDADGQTLSKQPNLSQELLPQDEQSEKFLAKEADDNSDSDFD